MGEETSLPGENSATTSLKISITHCSEVKIHSSIPPPPPPPPPPKKKRRRKKEEKSDKFAWTERDCSNHYYFLSTGCSYNDMVNVVGRLYELTLYLSAIIVTAIRAGKPTSRLCVCGVKSATELMWTMHSLITANLVWPCNFSCVYYIISTPRLAWLLLFNVWCSA